MTHIDFYFNAPDLMRVAQKLIAKARAAGSTVVVAADAASLQAFDAYLWAFDSAGFVAHVYAYDAHAAQTPVLLAEGGEGAPPSHHGLLINLGAQAPSHFARYERVLELVSNEEISKAAGRERFKFYKQRGYPMKTVDLAKK